MEYSISFQYACSGGSPGGHDDATRDAYGSGPTRPDVGTLRTQASSSHRQKVSQMSLPELSELHQLRSTCQEEAAHLSRNWLQEGIREDVTSQSSPPVARGGTSVRLQLVILREKLHPFRRTAAPSADAHGRETLRVQRMWKEVYAK